MTRLKKTRVESEGTVYEKLSLMEDEELKPWDTETELKIVGKSFAKIDGDERVTGRAIYTSDIQLPGMLHAKALRSPYPNARVKRIDATKAANHPGVRAVITHENIPSLGWLNDTKILDGAARFAGEEVAVVAADEEEMAEEAISLIEVEYDVLPFVVDAENANKVTAPIIQGENNLLGGAPRTYHRGDVNRGLTEADIVVEGTFTTQTAVHNCMETHSAVADWNGDHLTVWESTQSIANTREHLAAVFNLPLNKVHVICYYMGGGFGSKQRAGKHTLLAALLSKITRRPVRMVLTRREDNLMTGNRQATVQHLRLGAKSDGTLTAIDLTSTGEMGAYGTHSSLTEGPAQTLYECQNVKTDNRAYFTNMGPAVAFRGPGYVEGSFALESLLDELAEKLGIDPLELRIKNYAHIDPRSGRGYSSKNLDVCYRRGAEMVGWDKGWRGDRTGSKCRAIGVASQIWGGGGGPPAYAWVKMNPDATFEVIVGGQDIGSGTKTTLAQIAAEELGVALDRISIRIGDTEAAPYAPVSSGSRTTPSVGPAVRQAAADAKRQLREIAAGYIEVPLEQVALREGEFYLEGEEKPRISVEELTDTIDELTILGRGIRGPNPNNAELMTFGAQFADVEVDLLTGDIDVKKVVTVLDFGRVLNPLGAGSQLEGGVVQGIGFTLSEGRVVDGRDGVVLNPNLENYLVPTNMDMPVVDYAFTDVPDPTANNLGAKGLGEPPMIPTAPAIANAIASATGVRIRSTPITRAKILDAIQAAKEVRQ